MGVLSLFDWKGYIGHMSLSSFLLIHKSTVAKRATFPFELDRSSRMDPVIES